MLIPPIFVPNDDGVFLEVPFTNKLYAGNLRFFILQIFSEKYLKNHHFEFLKYIILYLG